jgi:inhibitor of cysteine peptidase
MKKSLVLAVVPVLLAGLATGCASQVKAYYNPEEPIGSDINKEFVILIALESNPTTGYSWEAKYDETKLELVEETYELGEYAKQGLVGAGGTELFRFRALAKGEAQITMEYKRPWETQILEQKVFTVDIK